MNILYELVNLHGLAKSLLKNRIICLALSAAIMLQDMNQGN